MYLRKVREAKLDKIGRKKEMGGFVKLSQHIYWSIQWSRLENKTMEDTSGVVTLELMLYKMNFNTR